MGRKKKTQVFVSVAVRSGGRINWTSSVSSPARRESRVSVWPGLMCHPFCSTSLIGFSRCSSRGAGTARENSRMKKVSRLLGASSYRASKPAYPSVLLQHQKSKHFKCQLCPRKLHVSITSMVTLLTEDRRRFDGTQSAGPQMRPGTVRARG
jgi:hypothetical protein